MSTIPAWVYHPDVPAGKIVHTLPALEQHLADGWADQPFPPQEKKSTPANPCPGCEQLRAERDALQGQLSALVASQMGVPKNALEETAPAEEKPKTKAQLKAEAKAKARTETDKESA
jgi:hypothetical protein